MKTLTKHVIAIANLTSMASTQAESVRGYFRSNGTYVMPYYRTPANGVPYDNLSYRGYPSQQPGYISPRKSGSDSSLTLPNYDFTQPSYNFRAPAVTPRCQPLGIGLQTMPQIR